MRAYKTEGIILKRTNFGEADRILTIFTKHYGKIKVLAKGVRKITSRRGPNVELFNWTILFLSSGKNFDLLTEAEVKDSFSSLRKNLTKVGLAYYLCELVDGLCPERQEHREVFNLLTETLQQLAISLQPSVADVILDFELKLLQELGYWPRNRQPPMNLEKFIEGILQRKLKTPKFLEKLEQS